MSIITGTLTEFKGVTLQCSSCGVKLAYRNFAPYMKFFPSRYDDIFFGKDYREKQNKIVDENNKKADEYCVDINLLQPSDFFEPINEVTYCINCINKSDNLQNLLNNSKLSSKLHDIWSNSDNRVDILLNKKINELSTLLANLINTYNYDKHTEHITTMLLKNKLNNNGYIQKYVELHSKYVLAKIYESIDKTEINNLLCIYNTEYSNTMNKINNDYEKKYRFIDKCLVPIKNSKSYTLQQIPKSVKENNNRCILCMIKDNKTILFEDLEMYVQEECKIVRPPMMDAHINIKNKVCTDTALNEVKHYVSKQIANIANNL